MKLLIIFISTILWAGNYEVKLYETIFTKLFHKKNINVYFQNHKKINSKILKSSSCKDADIVIITHLPNKCKNKPFFVTSYIDYINSNAVGAFYWRKSRPQLRLNKKVIKTYNLYLDKSLQKYAR